MPSDKPARRFEDILDNAHAIQRYVAGMDVTAFKADQKTYDAVERCLERISEAAAKLGAAIREDRLWDIVQVNLPPSCTACEGALGRLLEGQVGQ